MALTNGPYILRPFIQDLPLATEEADRKVVITCVEHWEGNLYVGTSAAEVLHYVSIPGEPGQDGTLIQASRTQPTTVASQNLSKGVQQLLILPRAKKACILCNGTLTFHTLPELSPAPNTQTVSNVLWIGGMDLDAQPDEDEDDEADHVMMSLRTKVRLLRVGERVTSAKSLDYPGCLVAARRGRYACVGDARSYALIDLENSQKIPLFPISSSAEAFEPPLERPQSSTPSGFQQNQRLATSPGPHPHSRNASLNTFMQTFGRQAEQRRPSTGLGGLETTEPHSGAASPARPSSYLGTSTSRPISPGRASLPQSVGEVSPERTTVRQAEHSDLLQPQMISPIPTEFLLLTGTNNTEPGVGMFVNLDGDVVRGTLEFSQYPIKIVVADSDNPAASMHGISLDDDEGYLFAAMKRQYPDGVRAGFEIHKWDDQSAAKHWLGLDVLAADYHDLPIFGISCAQTKLEFRFSEIAQALRSADWFASQDNTQENAAANQLDTSDNEFIDRLGQAQARFLIWYDDKVFWAARNPVLLQLDTAIESILKASDTARLDQSKLIRLFRSISGREARSETEFLSLEYIRQKISLILFADLAVNRDNVDEQFTEKLFLEAGTDPRLILSMIPFLRNDIFLGPSGLRTHAGIVELIHRRYLGITISMESDPVLVRPEDFDVLGFVKQFLTAWRQRKGFGSIVDETQVFASVDAALIHVLLFEDQHTSLVAGRSSMLGAQLYAIVDKPVDCFERAIELLEEHRHLFVLSRLYQSRRMARKVLETWCRILNGEPDDGGGFQDGENEIRRYLVNRTDRSLVEEYGCWLANRNPKLGVQVFTDDAAKIRFTPTQAEELLSSRAPAAVKVYLEHLVFEKKNVQYADELISYYLDNVLEVLNSSQEALSLLAASYQTYRALAAPKPTYRQFITDNAIPEPWWHDRLRLLELLGGSYGAGFSYDVLHVLERIQPFEEALVPESIILEGRQGQHLQALRLLTHGLGDYHTAINYCLLGGSSIFHPAESVDAGTVLPAPTYEEQTVLFQQLFAEFLSISSKENRAERTSELLERFGNYFDLIEVLQRIPEDWPIELVLPFLTSAIRRLVSEKNESSIIKALAGVENLKVSQNFVEKIEQLGAHIIPATDTPASM